MTDVVFVATVLVVALLFVLTARRARVSMGLALFVLVVTLVAPGLLARAELLNRYSPLPAPALVVIAIITVMTIWLALSSTGGRIARAVPLASLVGFQVFRIVVEWVLHRLYLDGTVPVQMTYDGRNFDVVSGLTAAVLALVLFSGRRPASLVLLWNLLGLGLLANIVTIAVLSTPVPFRHFMNEPANLLPSTYPYVWLPTFLVQAALFGHLVVFRALRNRRSY